MDNTKESARKGHGRARTWFQAAWFALTNGYARGYTSGKIFAGNTKVLCVPGLNCYSCPGAFASCPIGSLQAVLNKSSYKVSLYVFGMITAFGVLFGRLVCGWMCPFGLVQDLLHKIKLGPKKKNLPGHKYLRWLRFVVLVVMVLVLPTFVMNKGGSGEPWFCEWLCPSGTLLGGIPLVALNKEFQGLIGYRFAWKMFVLVVCLVAAVIYYRPFCKYLCPLGAIYGLFNPVSTYRLEVDPAKCVKCGACKRACGMDIATFQTPNSIDCIRCGDCLAACPTGALESTWGKMGTRIKSRCFIDDDVARDVPVITNEHPKITIFLGVLASVGGLCAVWMTAYTNIFNELNTRMAIPELSNLGPGTLVFSFFKVAAAALAFLAGVYVLRNRNDSEKVCLAYERLRLAHRVYLVGLVPLVMAIIADPRCVAFVFTPAMMNFWCLLCLPFVRGLASALKTTLEGGEAKIKMRIMIVMSCVTMLGFMFMTFGSTVSFIYEYMALA